MEIRPVAGGGRTDEQTDVTKLVVTVRNFEDAPETILPIDTVISHVPT